MPLEFAVEAFEQRFAALQPSVLRRDWSGHHEQAALLFVVGLAPVRALRTGLRPLLSVASRLDAEALKIGHDASASRHERRDAVGAIRTVGRALTLRAKLHRRRRRKPSDTAVTDFDGVFFEQIP